MSVERFTAFITRYALTSGIQEMEVEYDDDKFPGMVTARVGSFPVHFHSKDWHRTRAAAVERANHMRRQKIAALTKKIAALQNLKFE